MYSISALERISDVKAHTIRIWEKRYRLFTPVRTEGNHRLYTDDDLIRLLTVNRLVRSGLRISLVSSWTDVELAEKLSNLEKKSKVSHSPFSFYIDEMITAAISYDEVRFNKAFQLVDGSHTFFDVWISCFVPVLNKIGSLWITKKISPAQEHFISHLIRRKIDMKIDNLPAPEKTSPALLLFLPSNEYHELGLLMTNYFLRREGWKVIYLGDNLPVSNLIGVMNSQNPKVLITYTHGMKLNKNFINFLQKSDSYPCTIIIAGSINKQHQEQVSHLEKVRFMDNKESIISYLDTIKL